jgi:hypothetical protein
VRTHAKLISCVGGRAVSVAPENALIGSEKGIPVVDQHDSEEMGLKRSMPCEKAVRIATARGNTMADLKSLKLTIQ